MIPPQTYKLCDMADPTNIRIYVTGKEAEELGAWLWGQLTYANKLNLSLRH